MKIAWVPVLATVVAALSCGGPVGPGDPDAAMRDRTREEVMRLVDGLALPTGYEVVGRLDERAQTPAENRGGGQGGRLGHRYRVPGRPVAVVAREMDEWFTTRGFVRVGDNGAPSCTATSFYGAWGDDRHLVFATYRSDGVPERDDVLWIPYGVSGVVDTQSPDVRKDVAPATCP